MQLPDGFVVVVVVDGGAVVLGGGEGVDDVVLGPAPSSVDETR
ncbi:MAG TPA: hypothetical protein VEI83_11040 [Acidimicrobiales bacterium]|nr:hypothetical protein [Acidimicrobiales bacterium]